jgi:hypothetical protein
VLTGPKKKRKKKKRRRKKKKIWRVAANILNNICG